MRIPFSYMWALVIWSVRKHNSRPIPSSYPLLHPRSIAMAIINRLSARVVAARPMPVSRVMVSRLASGSAVHGQDPKVSRASTYQLQ